MSAGRLLRHLHPSARTRSVRRRAAGLLTALALALSTVVVPAAGAGPAFAADDLIVQGPSFAVNVAPAGGIDSVVFSDGRVWSLGGRSLLTEGSASENCVLQGQAASTSLGGASWISRCTDARGRATDLTEQLTPTATSVSWTLTTKAEQGTYSTGIATKLTGFSDSHTRLFWTTSGQTATSWTDPLHPAAFTNMSLPYGGHALAQQTGFSVPLATIIEPDTDHSLSLIQSPRDTILSAQLATTTSGDVQLTRSNNRIGADSAVTFHMDLVASAADWRGGLAWMTKQYPSYFTSGNPQADRLAGLGSYSAFPGPFTATLREKMRAQDVRMNWELSLHGPYFGEFMPPVTSSQQTWTNYISHSNEAPGPATVSVDSLRSETRGWREAGLEQLAYFNTTEFGDKNTQTAQAPSGLNCSAPDLWADANANLYCNYPHAILRDAAGNPTFSYFGTVVMDNGDPAYQQHLLDQAKALMTQLPDYSGINIDRMDWLEQYNVHADDGVSWYDGAHARSLITSWKSLLTRLTAQMHADGKQVWVSPTDAKRIDELAGVDGIQSEFNNNDAAMNMDAFMGLQRPVIGWNYSVSDDILQHYLYMGSFPQSDIPQNDHGLGISAATDQLYRDYAAMFRALAGKKWYLAPHAVTVTPSSALANVFTTPDGVVIPVIGAGSSTQATVSLPALAQAMPNLDLSTAQYLTPGSTTWKTAATSTARNVTQVTVPLVRGTVLVRIPTFAIEAGRSNLSRDPLVLSLTPSSQWVSATQQQTLTATIRNQSAAAVNHITASINTPSGWTVTRTDSSGSVLPPGRSATLTWTVSAPDTATGSIGEIRPQLTYQYRGDKLTVSDAVRLVVGAPYPTSQMTATSTSSLSGNPPSSAIDGDPTTFWHSAASSNCLLESMTIDLGRTTELAGLAYLPRQDGSQNGLINSYNLYTSTDGTSFTKVSSGTWAWDMGLLVAPFSAAARYLRLESAGGFGPWASVAEVTPILRPTAAAPLAPTTAGPATATPMTETTVPATCASASSAQPGYPASNAIDGDTSTIWHTQFSPYQPLPQSITLRLDASHTVNQLSYLPRQDGYPNGDILGYNLYTSPDGRTWTLKGSGSWPADATLKVAAIPPTAAAYVRLEATSGDGGWASAAEITIQQGS